MPFDFSKLKGLITERFNSQEAFASALGISPGLLSRRLNNKTQFKPEEIIAAAGLLSIAPEDIGVYFFTVKVR
jgi:transcriptional regulator with XRE-family HTH domain